MFLDVPGVRLMCGIADRGTRGAYGTSRNDCFITNASNVIK